MRKAQQYAATLSAVRILAFLAGWLVLSHGSLADVAMSGSFLANADCPAFQMFQKGYQPGWGENRSRSFLPAASKKMQLTPLITAFESKVPHHLNVG
jgi:hypothetical protein